MATCPDDLVWAIVSRNNCFLHKRNGQTKRSGSVVMSSEPLNLMNKNAFKYSQLANSKAVGVNEGADSKGRLSTVLSLKGKKSKTPSKSVGSTVIKKTYQSTSKAIKAQVTGSYYRPDLEAAAQARWARVYRSIRTQKEVVKPMVVKAGRSSSA